MPNELSPPADAGSLRAIRTALIVLAVLASVFMLSWASDVLVPLTLGLMLSYVLTPLVDALQRWRVPRALGAGALMLALATGVGWTTLALKDEAKAIVATLPVAVKRLEQSIEQWQSGKDGSLGRIQAAADQLRAAARQLRPGADPAAEPVARVSIEPAAFNLTAYVLSGTRGALGVLAQTVVVGFITFFLLVAGDGFRRKLLDIAGPTLARQHVTTELLDQIGTLVKTYLLVQVFTSVLVGIGIGLSFHWLGMERAAVWGLAAGVLNMIPYLGSLIVASGGALFGFFQFGTVEQALLLVLASTLVHTLVGSVITPILAGRAGKMAPFIVFASMLVWGWLWGVWGVLLGAPIMMTIKAVCDRVAGLQPVGRLLGE